MADFETQDGVGPETVTAVLRHGLTREFANSGRQFFVGISQAVIAVSFVFFSLNTLQIRFKSHPGPVVNAVIALLSGLSYLLYTMVLALIARSENVAMARKLRRLLKKSANGNSPAEIISLAYRSGYGENVFEALSALTAAKETGVCPLSFEFKTDSVDYKEMVLNDLTTIRTALLGLRDDSAAAPAAVAGEQTPQRKTRSRAKSISSQPVSAAVLASLDAHKRSESVSGMTTFVFFAINFLAGYSYLMCVLAFYLPHEAFEGDSIIGAAVSLLMLNYPSQVADFWGGHLGDVFWTIEPLLVHVTPYVTKYAFKAMGKPVREKQE